MDTRTLDSILRNTGLLKEADDEGHPSDDMGDFNFEPLSVDTEPKHTEQDDDKETDKESKETPRAKLHRLMKPQVEVARQMIVSINNTFSKITTKKYKELLNQLKNFEKQMRGACQQVIDEAESINFDTNNNMICSPKAFSIISEYDSRDRSILELVAAIIVFSNSLT